MTIKKTVEAYEVLNDPEKRAVYDHSGEVRPSCWPSPLPPQLPSPPPFAGSFFSFPVRRPLSYFRRMAVNVISPDLVVIIDERPHGVFMRDGDDLIITEKVSPSEALTGYTVKLTMLDGRSLIIPIISIISPGYEEIIHGEGMPCMGKPGMKGNLKIRFQIKFPTKLLGEQKATIMQLLASS